MESEESIGRQVRNDGALYQGGTGNGRFEESFGRSPTRLACELAVRKREKLKNTSIFFFYQNTDIIQ